MKKERKFGLKEFPRPLTLSTLGNSIENKQERVDFQE